MNPEEDSITDRAARVRHSLAKTGLEPDRVQATIDGPCPNTDCDGRIIADIHGDTRIVTCSSCNTTYPVSA